jgi:hypothetical protein
VQRKTRTAKNGNADENCKITQKPEASEALLIARFVDYWIVISGTRSEIGKA